MKKRIWRKRLAAAGIALCVALTVPLGVTAKTLEEIQNQQTQLEQEKKELEQKLDQLREDKEEKEEYQATLQEQIDVVTEQVDTARKNIDDLNTSINELTAEIEKSQKEIEDIWNLFKERLKAIYTAGDVSTLQILLDSDSFTDFAMRTQAIESMSQQDQQMMDKLEEYMEKTSDEREECEAKKKEVAELKKTLESKQAELDDLYAENAAAIEEIEGAQGATENALAANEEELAANEAEIQALIEAQKAAEEAAKQEAAQGGGSSGGTVSGGGDVSYPTGGGGVEGFNPIWPMPGVTYVSCYYGGYSGHYGMDIAGPYGTPIVAAESGTVIAANDYDSWGDSWGYYVLVYHNSTFTTRYAHLSSLAVSNGQYVSQGQVVGYEGATGNVTGPHLHFEVYQNGVRVDPMNFL